MFDNWTTGRALRRHLDSLDPEADCEEIAAKVGNLLFADSFFAHTVYLVTFARQIAVPAIAKVLHRSGQGDIVTRPRQRTDDTIVFFAEFYRRGFKSDEGRAAIGRMEAIHGRFLISDELKAYTLATVVFGPDRLAEQFGEDPMSDVDRQARWNFWCGAADVMGLQLPAATREDFRAWMLDYEEANYAPTADGAACFDGLVEDWLRWYPSFVPGRERLARQSLSALLDPPLRHAMGVEPPPALVRAQTTLVAKLYMRSTPIRVFRRDRTLVDFFGRGHADPYDLETIGHAPSGGRDGVVEVGR